MGSDTRIPRGLPKKTGDAPTFGEFWRVYPRRVAKRDAMKAWKQVVTSAEVATAIMAALPAHCSQAQWRRDDGRYIPYPATWLRGGRWEDELDVKLPAQNSHSVDDDREAERKRNARALARVEAEHERRVRDMVATQKRKQMRLVG